MCKELIKSTVAHESAEILQPEKHLPFQKDKLIQMLEVHLEISIEKLEFLMRKLDKVKGKLADLESSWGECLPDLYINRAGFSKTEARKKEGGVPMRN